MGAKDLDCLYITCTNSSCVQISISVRDLMTCQLLKIIGTGCLSPSQTSGLHFFPNTFSSIPSKSQSYKG